MKPTKMRNMQTYRATFNKRSKGVSCALSTNLRKKYDARNIRVVTGDGVTVVRGEYKQVQGKVSKVSTLNGRLAIDGIKKEKGKGEKFDVMIHASAVVITDLNTDDQWRMKKLKKGRDIIDDKDPISKDSATVTSTPKTVKPKDVKTVKPTLKSTPKPKDIKTVKPTLKSTPKPKSKPTIKKSTSNAENIKGKKSD
ncbi:MAG: 50S ribosomal protein L24 [Candidatus Nitrosoabyssus spongiisocia]|nr:MAG: 50S ribosomal protein L24 [Nitrosopumilaceae archaeon AB1(1)]